jgi:hypothetical protein
MYNTIKNNRLLSMIYCNKYTMFYLSNSINEIAVHYSNTVHLNSININKTNNTFDMKLK